MTSVSEPLMLDILYKKLHGSNKPFFDIAAFMHKKYTEYLLTCLNGNTQVMDLVEGWCEMGVKYSPEMKKCKNDVKNRKLLEQVLSENADIKHELEVLKIQVKTKDDAEYSRRFAMSERVENDDNQNMYGNHENHENYEILDSPILKQEADVLEDLLTNQLLNNTDSMGLQIEDDVEISDSTIFKQDKDLLEDLLTNPSLNATDTMIVQINSQNNRNSSTEDILNRFSLDSELLDLTGRPENNGHSPNLNTDSITNTINHCITDSRKRFHEENVHQFRETRCVHCNRLFSTQTELNRHPFVFTARPLNFSVTEEFTGDLEFLCLEVQLRPHKKGSNNLIERLVCTRKTRTGGEKCNVRHDNCRCTIRKKKHYEKLFRRDKLACIRSLTNKNGCKFWPCKC